MTQGIQISDFPTVLKSRGMTPPTVCASPSNTNRAPMTFGSLWKPAGSGFFPFASLSVRAASGSPVSLARGVGDAIARVDSEIAITFTPLKQQVDAALVQERIMAMLSGWFSILALLLSALGLYGVTAYAVSRRRTEIGIRMAIGAAPAHVVRLVLGRVVILLGIGVLMGAGASVWASTLVTALLYGLEPRDPVTLLSSAAVLAAVGALAGWLPAYRASRIDPAEALRES
jgi:putative ABC transport system permease protein